MLILGIESSCDETSCAVAEMSDGERRLLSCAIDSQIETHARYGGVVPEIASRAHAEAICPVVTSAVKDSGISLSEIDAVAVTCTPGLIGSLLVGVSYAKALAFSLGVPLVPVNHIKAHVAAAYFPYPELEPPFLCLAISGGNTLIVDVEDYTSMKVLGGSRDVVASGSHTSIYSVTGYSSFEEIGTSRDDAAGEAFDKVGRVIGLSYPCGREMDELAAKAGDIERIKFPSPALRGDTFDFSFSGLKTAVINHVHNLRQRLGIGDGPLPEEERVRIAASFTDTVTEAIAEKVSAALAEYPSDKIVLAGGVAANSHLRKRLEKLCASLGASFFVPEIGLCGDNAAMVAAQGYYEYKAGKRADESLNAYASEEAAETAGIF